MRNLILGFILGAGSIGATTLAQGSPLAAVYDANPGVISQAATVAGGEAFQPEGCRVIRMLALNPKTDAKDDGAVAIPYREEWAVPCADAFALPATAREVDISRRPAALGKL